MGSAFGGALGTTFMTKALFLTGFKDISVVILLQKLQPIFAILLAIIFLRERFPRRFYLYALIAIVGGYFVTFKDPLTFANLASVNKTTLLIPLFALLAAFSWGSSTTFGKYSIKNINYGLLAALRFGLTVLIMAGPALYFYSASIKSVTDPQWNTLLIIVVTSGAAAMWLYYYGLKKFQPLWLRSASFPGQYRQLFLIIILTTMFCRFLRLLAPPCCCWPLTKPRL